MAKQLVVPPAVMLDAQRVYNEYFAKMAKEGFPEDLWLAIQIQVSNKRTTLSNWDLNLFTNADGKAQATLYPVIDEETDITQPFPVDVQD